MDYFQAHPEHAILLLLGLAFFPRITMFFFTSVVAGFGLLGWLGFIFAPHLTVAILATTYYWHTNPVLCIIAWFFALSGTGAEAKATSSTVSYSRR
jgi:hypothetical protein